MMKQLFFIVTIVILLYYFLSPTYQFAQAQTNTKTTNTFFAITKSKLIKQLATSPTKSVLGVQESKKPQPSPTIYIQPTIAPTKKLQKKNIPTPSVQSKPATTLSQTIETMNQILKEINNYRLSVGLSTVQSTYETCSFAAIRAQEIATQFDHQGFNQRMKEKTLPYTSWSQVTENIAMAQSPKQVVTLWENSPGHAANMRANTPFVCVRNYGNYYAYEGLRL